MDEYKLKIKECPECCWFCEEGVTEEPDQADECDDFDLIFELTNPDFKSYLISVNFQIEFMAQVEAVSSSFRNRTT